MKAATAPGLTGPQGPPLVEWRFRRPRYEHDTRGTAKRQYCVRVLVIQHSRVIAALATRIHRNTREFEWREADPRARNAVLVPGYAGVCHVADEGITWCRGRTGADADALRAAAALAAGGGTGVQG